jgi:hypothetical protein
MPACLLIFQIWRRHGDQLLAWVRWLDYLWTTVFTGSTCCTHWAGAALFRHTGASAQWSGAVFLLLAAFCVTSCWPWHLTYGLGGHFCDEGADNTFESQGMPSGNNFLVELEQLLRLCPNAETKTAFLAQ